MTASDHRRFQTSARTRLAMREIRESSGGRLAPPVLVELHAPSSIPRARTAVVRRTSADLVAPLRREAALAPASRLPILRHMRQLRRTPADSSARADACLARRWHIPRHDAHPARISVRERANRTGQALAVTTVRGDSVSAPSPSSEPGLTQSRPASDAGPVRQCCYRSWRSGSGSRQSRSAPGPLASWSAACIGRPFCLPRSKGSRRSACAYGCWGWRSRI